MKMIELTDDESMNIYGGGNVGIAVGGVIAGTGTVLARVSNLMPPHPAKAVLTLTGYGLTTVGGIIMTTKSID